MRLVYADFNLAFELRENEAMVVIIENQHLFAEIVNELIQQCAGQDGGFVLSDSDKIKTISKEMQFIMNPFLIDCNEKKIIQKLYQEIELVALEEYIEYMSSVHSEIINCLDKLFAAVPYVVSYNIDQNIPSLLKAYNVQIDAAAENLLEKLINYLRVLNQLCHIHVIGFVNLKTFLSDEEVMQLYEFAFYQKIQLILFENVQKSVLQGEKTCIIDKDQCIININ